jgi:hypothetical protein
MTVYSVDAGDGDPRLYFATQREALHYAHSVTAPEGFAVLVEKVVLVPLTKAVIVRLLNVAGGYVDSAHEIAHFPTPSTSDADGPLKLKGGAR